MTSSALRRAVSAVLGLAALTLASTGFTQTTLLSGFGGTAGYGTSCLSPNDDGSSNSIDLTAAFPSGLQFFSGHYTSMYVNTNGNISFSGPVSVYTPAAFPVASQPMIAPYWADVDIRNENGCTGGAGTGSPGNGPCINPSTNGVWWHLQAGQIVVTWDHVEYYTCESNHVMNFQLILTDPGDGCPGDFDVEFRYNVCGWETGDASGGTGGFGGTPAQCGFDAGDRTHYVSIPGSRAAGIAMHMCTSSNVTPGPIPGVWRFQIRRGVVVCPGAGTACDTGMHGICSAGLTQCMGMSTTCVPQIQPRPMACNGLDNDCDGVVDTGPCPAGTVCDGAQCVPMCVEGGCFPGQVCTTAGLCVDAACATMTCPAGQRCSAGACVGGCTGVTCPLGQVCRIGACVDACSGVTCASGTVCVGGVCQATCNTGCAMCPAGQTCASDGRCTPTACATVTCPAGQACMSGACVDACTGAVCPAGETCTSGYCQPIPVVDAGPPDTGEAADTGNPGGDTGSGNTDSGGPDAGASDGRRLTDARATGDGSTHVNDNAGCACSTTVATHTSGRSHGAAFVAAVAMMGFAARRRRTSARVPR